MRTFPIYERVAPGFSKRLSLLDTSLFARPHRLSSTSSHNFSKDIQLLFRFASSAFRPIDVSYFQDYLLALYTAGLYISNLSTYSQVHHSNKPVYATYQFIHLCWIIQSYVFHDKWKKHSNETYCVVHAMLFMWHVDYSTAITMCILIWYIPLNSIVHAAPFYSPCINIISYQHMISSDSIGCNIVMIWNSSMDYIGRI